MRLVLVSILLDPPHCPVPNRFTLEVETDREEGKECHDSRVHPVGLHVAKLRGGRHQTAVGKIRTLSCRADACMLTNR